MSIRPPARRAAVPSWRRLPLLLLGAGAAASTMAAQGPAAAQVLAAHARASGGPEALASITSIRRSGTVRIASMGVEGSFRIERRRPDRYLATRDLGTLGLAQSGFDGTTAWETGPRGASVLAGHALADMRRTAAFDAELRTNRVHEYLGPAEATTWEGCDCWRLRARNDSGQTRIDFFDRGTGLYAGTVDSVASPAGMLERRTIVREYTAVGRLRLPSRTVVRLPQFETVLELTETVIDRTDDAVFAPPAAVRDARRP